MKTTRTSEQSAPCCGYGINTATDLAGSAVPKPGDVSLCGGCGAFLTYAEDLSHRLLSASEFVALDKQTRRELVRLRGLHEEFRAAKGK